MKKNILLLDTSFSAKPIYDYLISTGAEVFVIGGNPSDYLAKSVKNYINIDYSKISEVQLKINTLEIDFIVPGGNDLSYKICSELNELSRFINIDSIENNEIINNKEKFRKFSVKNGLHVPKMISRNNLTKYLPVIVKPVDAYSGHGISIIRKDDKDHLDSAINSASEASKSGKYMIEEYVEGQLFSHSAFVSNGKIEIDFIVKEFCFVNKYAVDTSHVVYDFDQGVLNQIRNDIAKIVQKLGLVDGLMHTQFILKDKSLWIIEVTRRCPGDLYSMLIETSTGFPYAEYYSKPFIGEENQYSTLEINPTPILRHTITIRDEGIFESLNFKSNIDIIKYVPLAIAGDRIHRSPYGRIGLLFSKSNSESNMIDLVENFQNGKVYSVN